MKTPNFTPGDWHFEKSNGLRYVRSSHPKIVATVESMLNGIDNEAKEIEADANARLIAAAPALYDALMSALPYVETALEDKGYKPGVVDRMVSNIREALALVDSPDAETGAEIASKL